MTRRVWAELDGLFRPDAEVVVDRRSMDPVSFVGPAALAAFIAVNVDQFEFFEFVILNVWLDMFPDGDMTAATGRMWMCELRQDAQAGRATTVYGLYRDQYQKVDGRWWFAHRHYDSLARHSRDLDVFPIPSDLQA